MNPKRILYGIGVSPGLAVGTARVIQWELPEMTQTGVASGDVEPEVERLHDAVAAVRGLLLDLRDRTHERAGPEEAKIFDAQILMLEDPDFLKEVEGLIRDNQLSAERAFEFKTLEMRALWSQSSSSRLRQRVADLAGIQLQVMNHLAGHTVQGMLQRTDGPRVVAFTRQLTPNLTIQLDQEQVAGFASEEGTRTAHAAILARSLGLPCVMGLVGGLERIEDGMTVVLDGTQGRVLLDPRAEEIAEAQQGEQRRRAFYKELESVVGRPAITTDGETLTLRGNLDLPEQLDAAHDQGAEGIGLLRTEFLVLGRTELPNEDEQAAFFERVARRFHGHPVVVRSYDLGGDKFPASFHPAPEANPFLGWRAIRVCLDQPEVFHAQIRALLRARLHGDIQLMLPLITQLDEVEATRTLVARAVEELQREGTPAAEDLPVGVMIETPAAMMIADRIAARSDFLSVGTNDLTQYTLAVDRGNARLADRFTPHHPAILRMLKRILEVGKQAGFEPSVCGEMASEPLAAFLLLGLGYRVLSVAPPVLPLIRWLVRQVDAGEAHRAAQQALKAATTSEVISILEERMGAYVDLSIVDSSRLPSDRSGATLNSHF